MIVKVPQFPWYGDTDLNLDFPDSWEVIIPRMAGEKAPKQPASRYETPCANP